MSMKYAQMMVSKDIIPKALILLALELFISKKMRKTMHKILDLFISVQSSSN